MEDYPYLTTAISRVITRLREDAGLSKRKLAMTCGIDRVYLLQVEQGKYRPTINFMFLVAKGLGVPVEEIIRQVAAEQKALAKSHKRIL